MFTASLNVQEFKRDNELCHVKSKSRVDIAWIPFCSARFPVGVWPRTVGSSVDRNIEVQFLSANQL